MTTLQQASNQLDELLGSPEHQMLAAMCACAASARPLESSGERNNQMATLVTWLALGHNTSALKRCKML
jgi:hypothetical protein